MTFPCKNLIIFVLDEQVPQGWNKAYIRSYGKLGEKTNDNSERTEYEDKEPLNRIGRMRMMREKLRMSRNKSNLQPVSEEMKIKTLQMEKRSSMPAGWKTRRCRTRVTE